MAEMEELVKKLELLEREVNSSRSNRSHTTISTNTVGGLPEAKHLDGTNYADWKFWMENFLVDEVCGVA
jgi:hypothetical protein